MSFKRITPEQVLESYKKTNLKPMQHKYYVVDATRGKCACGLGTMIYEKYGLVPSMGPAHDLLGLSQVYTDGFCAGFDKAENRAYTYGKEADFTTGYQDGLAALQAVQQEYSEVFSYWEIV